MRQRKTVARKRVSKTRSVRWRAGTRRNKRAARRKYGTR
jgi:hypothetical protein